MRLGRLMVRDGAYAPPHHEGNAHWMGREGRRGDQDTPTAVALEEATVAFRLGDGRVYTAVEKARLTVAQGEFVAIVGPTGCGKSTLLNVAAGLLQPAGGSAKIFGRPLAGLNRDAGY